MCCVCACAVRQGEDRVADRGLDTEHAQREPGGQRAADTAAATHHRQRGAGAADQLVAGGGCSDRLQATHPRMKTGYKMLGIIIRN